MKNEMYALFSDARKNVAMKNEMTREQADALLVAAKQMLECPKTNQPGMYAEFSDACNKLQEAVDQAEANTLNETQETK